MAGGEVNGNEGVSKAKEIFECNEAGQIKVGQEIPGAFERFEGGKPANIQNGQGVVRAIQRRDLSAWARVGKTHAWPKRNGFGRRNGLPLVGGVDVNLPGGILNGETSSRGRDSKAVVGDTAVGHVNGRNGGEKRHGGSGGKSRS
jgi:hypothetical protein